MSHVAQEFGPLFRRSEMFPLTPAMNLRVFYRAEGLNPSHTGKVMHPLLHLSLNLAPDVSIEVWRTSESGH